MKTALIILSSVVLLFATEDSTISVVKIGIGPKIGSDGFGVSGRIWVKERFGLSINAGSAFDREQEGGEMQFNFKLLKPSLVNPYLLVGGGIQRINIEDMNPQRINEPMGTFSAGVGAEAILGFGGRHGFSAEAAWRSGSVVYRGHTETAIGDDTQHSSEKKRELVHPSAKLLYHFYFVPWQKREKPVKVEPIQEIPVVETAKVEKVPVADTVKVNPVEKVPVIETAKVEPIEEAPVVEIAKVEPTVELVDTVPIREPVMEKAGKPELTKEELAALNAIFSNTITFSPNSAELTQILIAVLDQLTDTLKAYPNLKLRIEGHTDITGNPEINRQLSQDRAELVKRHLTNGGIESDRITAEGLGADKPIADNNTDEGRTKNRRVELIITP
jgi:outer membrane protein OmpA-like peptidoglycan-associated protein